jgi:hypothetical protein
MSGSGSDCFNSIRRYAASTPDKLFAVSHRLLSGFLKREPHEDQSNSDNQEWPRPGVEPQQPGRMFEVRGRGSCQRPPSPPAGCDAGDEQEYPPVDSQVAASSLFVPASRL